MKLTKGMKLILRAISKNNESYFNLFELLEQLQLWREVETDEENETDFECYIKK